MIVGCGRTDERLEAAKGVRNLIAFYGSTPAYKAVLDLHGWGDLQPELNALSRRGDWATMGTLISDEIIDTIAVHGTPAQCAEAIVARYGQWAERVCAYFPYYRAGDDLIAEFNDEVHKASASASR